MHKIKNTPADDEDIVNKQYVDKKTEIDDKIVSSVKTWSSEKISKINVSDAKKVDAKPTYATGTITYVKDGTSYTTTNTKQWFYYFDNGSLKQTIFIDGEELTIDGASVDFDEYVKKISITDTIDSTSTSTDIASALSVYNYAIKDKRLKTYSINTNEDFPNAKTLKDISNNLPSNSIAIIDSSYDSTSFFGLPNNKFVIVWIRRYSGRDSIMAYTTTGSNIYNCNNVTNQTWTKICNTSVDDVDKTDITLPKISGLNVTVGELWYTVKNGWCNVNFYLGASSSTYLDWTEITTELPKPYALVTDCLKSDFSSSPNILLQIIGGKLKITCSEAIPKNTTYYCNISYPVAES